MASVTGMTKEAIDAEFAKMVVSIRVSDTGRLLFKDKSGNETDGGLIGTPDSVVNKAHPVGSIFIATVNTNPNALLGIGTWVRFGQGRTLVSQYDSDPEFDVAEELGGAKTVTLTAGQSGMPYHAHYFSYSGGTAGSTVNAEVTSADADSNPAGSVVLDRGSGAGGGTRTIQSSNHGHAFSVAGNTSAASANAAEAHPNMPPYIVVYMWKRTA